MNVLDLFSGIGAFSIAAESAGMNVIAHSEIDKNCQKLLKQKYPNVPQLGDICHVKKENIGQTVTLIAGGSPCQNLSIAGRGEGLAGKESQLWFEYLRLVKEFSPEWLVWENVPNALSSNGGLDFLTILRGLDECGYHVAWRVLDAQYFGVPQRRRRIFIVGHLRDGRAAKVLFDSASLSGSLKTRPGTWQSPATAPTLTANAGGTNRMAGQGNELDFLVFQQQAFDTYVEGQDTASTLKARDYKDYGDLLAVNPHVSHRMNPETGKLETIEIPNDLLVFSPASYKRGVEKNYLHRASIAATLRAKNNSGSTDSEEHLIQSGLIRRFTPLECERLMGFPDGHTIGFSDSARYSMLGNSIAVPVAKWIFERIAEVNNETN